MIDRYKHKTDIRMPNLRSLALALRMKEGSELVSAQLSSLQGATLDAFCWQLVAACLPDLPRLSCDPYAAPLIQRFLTLDGLATDLSRRLVRGLKGQLLRLTRDKRGCWATRNPQV